MAGTTPISADVVQEAHRTGARGYVLKTDAGSELLIAINVVLRGEQFVSRRLADQQSTDNSKITPCHEAGFYSSDQSLLDHLTQFIGAAPKRGNAAIVIATESHRENLFPRLQEQGLDMTAALEQGRYAGFDAGDTLSMCMQDQMPDASRFSRVMADRIQAAANAAEPGRNRVAVFGECVQLLWEQGHGKATIALERLWNQEVLGRHNVEVLCGYCGQSVHRKNPCRTHSGSFPVAGLRSSRTTSPLHVARRALLPVAHKRGSWFHPSALIESQYFRLADELAPACS